MQVNQCVRYNSAEPWSDLLRDCSAAVNCVPDSTLHTLDAHQDEVCSTRPTAWLTKSHSPLTLRMLRWFVLQAQSVVCHDLQGMADVQVAAYVCFLWIVYALFLFRTGAANFLCVQLVLHHLHARADQCIYRNDLHTTRSRVDLHSSPSRVNLYVNLPEPINIALLWEPIWIRILFQSICTTILSYNIHLDLRYLIINLHISTFTIHLQLRHLIIHLYTNSFTIHLPLKPHTIHLHIKFFTIYFLCTSQRIDSHLRFLGIICISILKKLIYITVLSLGISGH